MEANSKWFRRFPQIIAASRWRDPDWNEPNQRLLMSDLVFLPLDLKGTQCSTAFCSRPDSGGTPVGDPVPHDHASGGTVPLLPQPIPAGPEAAQMGCLALPCPRAGTLPLASMEHGQPHLPVLSHLPPALGPHLNFIHLIY